MMNEYSKSNYVGMHGHMSEYGDSSALSRMQQQYWTTKQAVFKKLGKKEDDCIIASDLELDLKLELFQTIEESFLTLMRVLENYQDKLCALAQEENALGRFLKENGKQDRTRAGKAMSSAGKALSYSAQQRLTLRIPLVRLYQEVETFQYRAIVDTLKTVEKMEKARTAYRGSLMWMKDVSQQLDPDTCKQMEKFRKVQSKVRASKFTFDNLKLDTLQKVDLLSFSRCNLFSQALAAYQNALINVCKKISSTSNSVAAATKGYQHYEFSTLKELTETSKKLAEETSDLKPLPADDKDTILFFEAEYHDDDESKANAKKSDSEKLLNHSNSPCKKGSKTPREKTKKESKCLLDRSIGKPDDLINLSNEVAKQHSVEDPELLLNDTKSENICNVDDFLTDNSDGRGSVDDELMLLNDIVNLSSEDVSNNVDNFDGSLMSDWQAVFGNERPSPSKCNADESHENTSNSMLNFLPSQLLTTNNELKDTQVSAEGQATKNPFQNVHSSTLISKDPPATTKSEKGKQDMSAWFNLFADLDPLSNPDLIGKKKENQEEGSC